MSNKPTQPDLFDPDLELGKCPECGFLDTLEQFDCMGACDGQVFCPQCSTEFNFDTGLRNQRCPQCEEIEAGNLSPDYQGDDVIYGP